MKYIHTLLLLFSMLGATSLHPNPFIVDLCQQLLEIDPSHVALADVFEKYLTFNERLSYENISAPPVERKPFTSDFWTMDEIFPLIYKTCKHKLHIVSTAEDLRTEDIDHYIHYLISTLVLLHDYRNTKHCYSTSYDNLIQFFPGIEMQYLLYDAKLEALLEQCYDLYTENYAFLKRCPHLIHDLEAKLKILFPEINRLRNCGHISPFPILNFTCSPEELFLDCIGNNSRIGRKTRSCPWAILLYKDDENTTKRRKKRK